MRTFVDVDSFGLNILKFKEKNMQRKIFAFMTLALIFIIFRCGIMRPKSRSMIMTDKEVEAADLLNIGYDYLKKLKIKPLYKFSPLELDSYLGYLQTIEPDLKKRVQHLALKCVDQPYQIFLLGEFPFEIYDLQPLFSLDKSDCVVFSEHIYAMALSYDWKSFFAMLQRIRYKNGEIGLATRNHYTEFDWDVNNHWLVHDITEELVGEQAIPETTVVDRAKFLSKWGIGQSIPIDTLVWFYIPYKLLPQIIDKLLPGDFVNIVRGDDDHKFVGHVGLITVSEDGTVNFLHSSSPRVREEPLLGLYQEAENNNEKRRIYNAKVWLENQKIIAHNERLRERSNDTKSPEPKSLIPTRPYFYGFKFLRLQNDPIWELMKIDGPFAPGLKIGPLFD